MEVRLGGPAGCHREKSPSWRARDGRGGIVTKIAIIGAGNMGEALLAGLLADGTATPPDLWATDVERDRLSALQSRYGIRTGHDNREAASWADVVVLAVKPQMMGRVLD